MESWLCHPRHVAVISALAKRLRATKYRFRRLNPVIFLCGGSNSQPRDRIRDYLLSKHPHLLIFYAETVWEQIAARADRSALQMEAELGALADLVLIVVESPGTFAELGAFALSDSLRPKLLPVLDRRYKTANSFISTGPIRWIDQDSVFRPSIWTHQEMILDAAREIDERLARIPKGKATAVTDLGEDPRHLLFFLCDLVAIVQPATRHALASLVEQILGPEKAQDVDRLLSLARAMGLVTVSPLGGADEFYLSAGEGLVRPYHRSHFVDLPSERAKYLAAIQLIPAARDALAAASKL